MELLELLKPAERIGERCQRVATDVELLELLKPAERIGEARQLIAAQIESF